MQTRIDHIQIGEVEICSELDYKMDTPPQVISLHGGGSSDRNNVEYLTKTLCDFNKNMVRFDFSGQGQSGGMITESSLQRRHDETLGIMDYYRMNEDITMIGTSMGGYIASSIIKERKINNLILFCPAAYTKRAWNIAFGHEFSDIIREKDSYEESDIIELLSVYTNNALLFIGENDEVIPNRVIEMYEEGLQHAKYFRKIAIPECPHKIHNWVRDKQEIREMILREIARML